MGNDGSAAPALRHPWWFWVGCSLVIILSANTPFDALASRASPNWGGWGAIVSQLGLAVAALLAVGSLRSAREVAFASWPILGLLLWLSMTLFWTVSPGTTTRWAAVTVPFVLGYIGICARSTFSERVQLLHWSLATAFALGWLAGRRYPGVNRFGDKYGGLFGHSNFAAHAAALAVATGFLVAILKPRLTLAVIPSTLLCFYFVHETKSDTPLASLAVAATGIVALAALALSRELVKRLHPDRPGLWRLVLLGFWGSSALALTVGLKVVSERFPKALTFNERTRLWKGMLPAIERAPLTGYGGGPAAFSSPLSQEFNLRSLRPTVHPHNGFLDVTLMGGYPAALFLVIAVVLAGKRVADSFRVEPRTALAQAGLLLIVVTLNMTEPDFMQSLLPTTFGLLALCFPVGRISEIRAGSVDVVIRRFVTTPPIQAVPAVHQIPKVR